jgi:hypothetical protein
MTERTNHRQDAQAQIQQPSVDSQKIIAEGLGLTRKNLLDLSGRNRLLNFKHSGSKILRFVDELPNFIYAELMASAETDKKGFLISPVPLPKRNEYLDVEAKELKKIDVKTHARKLGINTEYEMLATGTSEENHHQDDKLQTLLYPEDMDRVVRRIQSEARTAIEESGVNMLFLCLGYLKWSDHDDSKAFNYAPLIMVPIEVERDKVDAKTGFAKFRLKYTGEDIFDNICLREKLAQMSIDLPSFEDFETPEKYFSALTTQLADIKPDWGIHRFVTMGFLSFGKMLMYLDLDPSKWPGEDGIADAAHIFDIFAGNHSGGDPIASEFDIDSDKKLPHISQVMDADSSQHSAILDVLAGRNIVIEGPPGTGKSQTITNLIAACIAEGKTVLFVAEKLAALQVVRKRLDSVGLGDFCLELHSHKSQKKAVLADLKKRLEMNTNAYRSAADNAETRLRELNLKKSKLIEYSKVINTPFGQTDMTPHQIFWKAEVLQKQCSQPYKPEGFAVPKDVEKLSLIELREHMDALQNLSDNLRNYFGGNIRRKGHYWHGLNLVGPVEYGRQQDLILLLNTLHSTANQAKTSLERLQHYGLDTGTLKTYKLERLEEPDFAHAHLFSFLDLNNVQGEIDECLTALQAYQSNLEALVASIEKSNLNLAQIAGLDAKIVYSSKLPGSLSFKEVQAISDRVNPALTAFKDGQPIFREAATYLGLSDHLDSISTIQTIVQVAAYCSKVEIDTLSHRNSAIEQSMSDSIVTDLPYKIEAIRKTRAELENKFNFDGLPSDERLIELSKALSSKKLFSSFSKEWRAARDEYKTAAKNDDVKNAKASAKKIDELLSFKSDLKTLNESAAYNTMLPGIFKGIDTDIDSLRTAIKFYESLRLAISPIPDFGFNLYACLRVLESKHYEWLAANHHSCVEALQGLTAAAAIRASFDASSTDSGIKSLIASIDQFNDELKKLKPCLDSLEIPSELTIQKLCDVLKEYEELQDAKNKFQSNKSLKDFGFAADREKLTEQVDILRSLSSTATKAKKVLPQTALQHVLCREGLETLQEIIEHLNHITVYHETVKQLTTSLPTSKTLAEFWGYSGTDENSQIVAIISKLDELDAETGAFATWCEVLNSYAELKNLGLDTIVSGFAVLSDPEVPFSDYCSLYHFLVYHALSNEVLRTNRVLGSFARVTHENLRSSFKEIDLELQKLNAQKLARELSRKPIPEGYGGRSPKEFTDARLIRHEIGKQKAHVPIRQLVNRAYDTLVAIKPCFMMGPLSVAQYIPPHRAKFDILIMDEASQVKPEDAIGVLARAKQVVVVGDSNQLPPTGFFDTLGGDDNPDEETTIGNSESILDVCKPLFQPLRRLRWHYRSQHQSLISFSNSHFYDNDLIIFPSPTAHSHTAGVKHVYVPDGIYTSQSNPIEAQRVVKEIMEMIEKQPDLTYGIVTLNAKQKMVIEDEIERVRKDNPVFDSYISDSEQTDEEFFVKNLESVQGDERDVIFISTTFGLDEEGTFRQHFGPINGKDGWRRLNVLFTRAKQHVRIFSSFQPERIKIDDTKEQRGLRALKDYLNYAITGIDNHSYLTGQEPDSDFERAVGNFLVSKGYDVVYQLGVAGYRIDMVVRHPQCPTDYVLAIECDGATYHSARSARDRDRLREENLRKLGWSHIHRIWSTDWFRRRDQEEARLLQAVELAVNAKVAVA